VIIFVHIDLYFGVTADTNTKWNLCINLSDGKTLDFSQGIYKQFGYADYCIPSDLQGTWQGYIPLEDYVKGEVTVTSVYFVTATSECPVTFDYLFIGKSLGEKVNFIIDEDTGYSVDYLINNEITAISNPVRNGYVFDGWFTEKEGGELIKFPVRVKKGGLNAYAHFTKNESAAKAVFDNNEVEILPGIDYKKIILSGVIGLTLFAGVLAGVISAVRRKRKQKLNIVI
jgi:uncharacterized repeat protein (TIGR02543 family)